MAKRPVVHDFGSHNEGQFRLALDTFLAGCDSIYLEYKNQFYPNIPRDRFVVQWLQKRVRIMHGSSAHTFIDIATGDVLKPASWSTPAKHARGNIYDEHSGLKWMGPSGPAYLKRGRS